MDESINQAFTTIKRKDFIPDDIKHHSGEDRPLPIGYAQTISQPSTVKMMLQWLNPTENDKVLDVGSGSGWTSALLAHIVGPNGHVYAVERIPELVEMGKKNCQKYNFKNVSFHQADTSYGLPQKAPFDKILVSASAKKLPEELLQQLKEGGKLIIPVKNDILEITKQDNNTYETITHPGFVFVPLI